MECLLIVDVQNDFIPGGKLPVPDGDRIVEVINRIQCDFSLVAATQDWHPPGHKSFASSHAGKKEFEMISLNGIDQILWPDHCVQNTKGAEFHDSLDSGKIEVIFRKGMDPEIDSYSGFFDNGRLKIIGLGGYLRDRSVTAVTICGLAADFCVYYSALDALELGFKTTILDSAVRAIDQASYEDKKRVFIEKGGILRSE